MINAIALAATVCVVAAIICGRRDRSRRIRMRAILLHHITIFDQATGHDDPKTQLDRIWKLACCYRIDFGCDGIPSWSTIVSMAHVAIQRRINWEFTMNKEIADAVAVPSNDPKERLIQQSVAEAAKRNGPSKITLQANLHTLRQSYPLRK